MFRDIADLFSLMTTILVKGGWILFVIGFYQMMKILYMDYIQINWYRKLDWVFLKVTAPHENETSPLAFEHIFNHMHVIHAHLTWAERYLEGQFYIWMVWEVTSIGGEIGNYVRVLKKHRNALESAIYSQFPQAEITETEDYFQQLPKYNTDTSPYDIFAYSLRPIKNSAYPIRSFLDFEHSDMETFVDPVSAVWEALDALSPHEMYVIQYVLRPIGDKDWKPKARELVKRLKGEKETLEHHADWFEKMLGWIGAILGPFLDIFIQPGESTGHKAKKEDELPLSRMLHLSEGEKEVINLIERNLSKWGYQTKIHCLYIAPREKYNPRPLTSAVIGAFKAFGADNINSLKPDLGRWTNVHYWLFKKWEQPIVDLRLKFRKRKLMFLIRNRWYFWGPPPAILSTESLASMIHFPQTLKVKVPHIDKVAVTKVQPPPELPIADI